MSVGSFAASFILVQRKGVKTYRKRNRCQNGGSRSRCSTASLVTMALANLVLEKWESPEIFSIDLKLRHML
ncbi:MAG: hypothetical protein OEV11_06415, partial [Deltaproteobacteria bacterium]|nr:hypothetical protein [Deltaproteobacteria bacterium]